MIKLITILFIFIITNLYAKEKVTLQLDWLHQFQFAGYYMAKEKGFYESKNLDVNIKEYTFGEDVVKKVLETPDTYGVGKSSLVLNKADGKELILLAAIFQNSPLILISTNPNIKTLKDIKNKKVMITNDAKQTTSILAMLKSNEIEQNEINILEHSFKIEDLISKKTDLMACYLSNEPFILKNKNVDFKIFDPKNFGFDFYEGIVFTSQNELDNNPKKVKNFYEATLKGWDYAFSNIEETAKLIYEKYNTQNKTLDSLVFEGEVLKELAKYEDKLLGNIDINKIKEITRVYSLLNTNQVNEIDYKNFIYNPSKMFLTKEEKQYLNTTKITYLTNDNFPPFIIYDEKNNELMGIEIDYIKQIQKTINKKFDIKVIKKNKEKLEFIKDNINSFKYEFARLDKVANFLTTTKDVAKINLAVATLINKPFYDNFNSFDGKSLAINKYEKTSKILKKQYPKINFIETGNAKESLDLLQKGKVMGMIGRIPALSYMINEKNLSNMKISATVPLKFHLKLTLNKQNVTLKNILNKAIEQINDKHRDEINSKYTLVRYETHTDYSWIYKIGIPLIAVIIFILLVNNKLRREIIKRKKIEEKLDKLANIDGLTDIYNRRKTEELYEDEINRFNRYQTPFSLIFFDIDKFKYINDYFGHNLGDDVIIRITKIVKEHIRKTDIFGRWGGDEFLIILPQTNEKEARIVVENIKKGLQEYKPTQSKLNVTCSFGIGEFKTLDTFDTLLSRVDKQMYEEKKSKKSHN